MSYAYDPYVLHCAECGRAVDERRETVWNKVVGWEKKRSQGGTNHIAIRTPLPEFRCAACMEKMLSGVNAGQFSLGW